jgi:hypothetical protein
MGSPWRGLYLFIRSGTGGEMVRSTRMDLSRRGAGPSSIGRNTGYRLTRGS